MFDFSMPTSTAAGALSEEDKKRKALMEALGKIGPAPLTATPTAFEGITSALGKGVQGGFMGQRIAAQKKADEMAPWMPTITMG